MPRRKRYDERKDIEGWLLEILTERALRQRGGETPARRTDEKGLTVWDEIGSDVNVYQLGLHPCSECGQPARTAIFELRSKRRTLLCETCRPRRRGRAR